jgi:hypothetical protein
MNNDFYFTPFKASKSINTSDLDNISESYLSMVSKQIDDSITNLFKYSMLSDYTSLFYTNINLQFKSDINYEDL